MRIRTASERKDQGFTLIELLVVVVIIGILAAIAIPVFLNQREKAADSAAKSDLKNAATAQEAYAVDNLGAYTADSTALETAGFKQSADVTTFTIELTAGGYCMEAEASNGSQPWVYISDDGGLQPANIQACPAPAPAPAAG